MLNRLAVRHFPGAGFALFAAFACVSGAAAAACDTALLDQYDRLSAQAEAEHRGEDVMKFRRNAAEACPEFKRWLLAGDAAAALNQFDQAAQAYAHAGEVADTRKESALAAARYAKASFSDGNVLVASTSAQSARELDPDSAEIRDIGRQIDTFIASRPLAAQDTKRAMDKSWPKLVLHRTLDTGPAGGGGAVVPGTMGGSARNDAGVAAAAAPARSVFSRIPDTRISFVSSKAEIDAPSRASVAALIEMLRSPEFADHKFVLVAHSDERGDPQRNWALSERRARFVLKEVEQRAPELAQRLSGEGKGASEPRYRHARTEAEHHLNRRLEVLVL